MQCRFNLASSPKDALGMDEIESQLRRKVDKLIVQNNPYTSIPKEGG